MHRLGDGRDIDARLQTLNAAAENGPRIGPGEDLLLHQPLEQCERGHAAGDGDALGAAPQEVQHGVSSLLRAGFAPGLSVSQSTRYAGLAFTAHLSLARSHSLLRVLAGRR